ncbi:PREDICTED: ganglioside-induced differentiation-associated protein 1-like [Priapulus caudatus]|uniref:Ganglioside-induced differentiation-associated protein 1-like n=1 Tax=Priapulus caudatus TaxID=37621 RepID=A0ABM1F2F9_PRICU|nr:PREDICTED: ganglioside-induced differentiation-associated protein 1-like [Priapulus caudatus]
MSDQSACLQLKLYMHPMSFYSQQVLFALEEKKLSCENVVVDLLGLEQYEPWYMKINLMSEVPALQHGDTIITDSPCIIDYLEKHFSGGDTPDLFPVEGSEAAALAKHFREELSAVPVERITFGLFFNRHLGQNPRATESIMEDGKVMYLARLPHMESFMKKHPELKEHCLNCSSKFANERRFPRHLENLEPLFDEIENQLISHSEERATWWLCCEHVTPADIILCILLERLTFVGLMERYWGSGKRPAIAAYRARSQTHPPFMAVPRN